MISIDPLNLICIINVASVAVLEAGLSRNRASNNWAIIKYNKSARDNGMRTIKFDRLNKECSLKLSEGYLDRPKPEGRSEVTTAIALW